ncbi:hypothetical protein CPB84DRAFT_253889 [Gymnopilus junonius]|uniref:Uncharacterized protein n=1 Tax=Gymnopilus junonius TaxID=109634 RepID=A0A9P5NF47_GYMJU|nr:hypothetical protein CPB84DRAFT_253889 [Gymnopilus junonius]
MRCLYFSAIFHSRYPHPIIVISLSPRTPRDVSNTPAPQMCERAQGQVLQRPTFPPSNSFHISASPLYTGHRALNQAEDTQRR